jgi:hypothetical protein
MPVNAVNQNNKLDLNYVEEIEINEQFSGMKVIAEDLRVSKKEVLNFNKDGTVTSKIGEKERKGFWYTDSRGKHCIRWDDKDESNCADIMKDDDGTWVKVKDDAIIKRYESFDKLNQQGKDKNDKDINIEKEVIRF